MNTRKQGLHSLSVLSVLLLMLAPVFCFAGAELETREDVEAVIAETSQLIKSAKEKATLYVQRGDAYFKLHEFDLAIEDFSRAIKLDVSLDMAYFGRGLAYGRRGLVDEGIADLSVFLQRNPASSLGYTKRGVRYLWKRDLENAGKDLRKAIALDANNAEAHDDLGVVYSLQGEHGKAITHFFQTVKIEPDYQKGYHNLAMAFYTIGKDQWALGAIDQALKLRHDARDSLKLKGNILMALGRESEAAELLEDAEFLPEGNWSERVSVSSMGVDPNLMLEGLDGKQHRIDTYIGKGKWIILNIWGPRCPPCIEEMPQLQAFHDDHKDEDAIVIGMAIDFPSFGYAKMNEVNKFIELNAISYPMFLGDAQIVSRFGAGPLLGTPTTLVYSPGGELVGSQVGQVTADLIESFILEGK